MFVGVERGERIFGVIMDEKVLGSLMALIFECELVEGELDCDNVTFLTLSILILIILLCRRVCLFVG